MMECQLYVVRDKAVGAVLPPFHCRSKGEAIRSFSVAVNTPDHQFHKHAADFSLWYIGSYDDASGMLAGVDPIRVIGGVECIDVSDTFPKGNGS